MALVKTKTGGARVERLFAGFAALAVLGVSVFLLTAPPAPQQAPPPRDPAELALAELMSGQILQFSAMQVEARLATYLDPTERTTAQLRNAHRTWSARLGDPAYGDQALANDMVLIIERAMHIRGVAPHPDA